METPEEKLCDKLENDPRYIDFLKRLEGIELNDNNYPQIETEYNSIILGYFFRGDTITEPWQITDYKSGKLEIDYPNEDFRNPGPDDEKDILD